MWLHAVWQIITNISKETYLHAHLLHNNKECQGATNRNYVSNAECYNLYRKLCEQVPFFNSHSGRWSPNWVHSARRPLNGLLYLPRVIMMMGNLVELRLAGETEVLGENLPQRHFVHHKSRAAAVGSQRLTAWAMARPWTDTLMMVILSRNSSSHVIICGQSIHLDVEPHLVFAVTTVTVLGLKAGQVCSVSNVMVSYVHEDHTLITFTILHVHFTRNLLSNTHMCKIFAILFIYIYIFMNNTR
jgi:hypothetical protein